MDPGRRYLIVTDHELDQDRLAAQVQQAMAAGPCQFHLLVLAAPPAGRDNFSDLIGVVGETAPPNTGQVERGWQWASHQLAHELAGLRKLGADADGETGEPHPLRAISDVLAKRPADEIILATSRQLIARMLAMDLPHRGPAPLRTPGHRPWRGPDEEDVMWASGIAAAGWGDSNSTAPVFSVRGQGAVGSVTCGFGERLVTASARCCPWFASQLRTGHGPAISAPSRVELGAPIPCNPRDGIAVHSAQPLASTELADDGIRVDPLAWL